MINKQNLWFLTLFSLILVLSVYYITMPRELMMTNNGNTGIGDENVNIYEMSLIETLREEDNNTVLEEINKYKNTKKFSPSQKVNYDFLKRSFDKMTNA